jgi:hypothetical protein
MSGDIVVLPGQETLIASWRALALLSPAARLIRSTTAVAAVFPSWAPLNNVILLTAPDGGPAAAAEQSTILYAQVDVDAWAFWVPSYAVGALPGLRRQGLVRALVEHVLRDARQRGARTATLQSTTWVSPSTSRSASSSQAATKSGFRDR